MTSHSDHDNSPICFWEYGVWRCNLSGRTQAGGFGKDIDDDAPSSTIKINKVGTVIEGNWNCGFWLGTGKVCWRKLHNYVGVVVNVIICAI